MPEFYAVACRRQDVREFLLGAFAAYRAELAALIRRGIERGEFRALDPDAVAITHMALFEGFALLWAVDPQGIDWRV